MPKNLLLADDSITIQKVVGITFAQEDYDITYVDNGEDAIKKAKEMKPDIILADIIMPQKNGYEVCETVKKDPELSITPVLLLAGTFETFDENRGKQAGADGYIIKPFESQALIDKVNQLVAQKGVPKVEIPKETMPVTPKPVTPTPTQPVQPQVTPQTAQPVQTPPFTTQPPKPEPVVKPQPVVPPAPVEPQPVETPKAEEIPMPDLITIPPQEIEKDIQPKQEMSEEPSLSEPPIRDKRMEPLLDIESVQGKGDMPLSPDLSQPQDKDEAIGIDIPDSDQPIDLASPADFVMDATKASSDTNELSVHPEPPSEHKEDVVEISKPPTFDFVSGESDLAPELPKEENEMESFPDLSGPVSDDFKMDQPQSFPGLDSEEFKEPVIEEAPKADIAMDVQPTEFDVRSAHEKSEETTSATEISSKPSIKESEEPLSFEEPKDEPSQSPKTDGSFRLPDDQMEEIVKKVSQNLIEKIAWEIVPEVAERIIKEEIKRLTDEEKK